MGSPGSEHKAGRRITMLSGGVGGARLARGLAAVTDELSIIINVGDDDTAYGVHVSADIDTVTYTLAGIEGDAGWGVRGDTHVVMDHLAGLGVDTSFRIGDRDLATCLARTQAMARGVPLSEITAATARRLGIAPALLPATDDPLRTMVQLEGGPWIPFQEYFVTRGHADRVRRLDFAGGAAARPAPGVLEAIAAADTIVIGPSNPLLSIWPILAVPGIRDAVATKEVMAVSPLIGGAAVKGPAAELLDWFGFGATSAGVVAAYGGLVDVLVVDTSDRDDNVPGVVVRSADTVISTAEAATRLAAAL